jgi:hypothetical protein
LIIWGVWGAKPPIEKKNKKSILSKKQGNGTLMTQMVMIRHDFIISDHHLNQRHLRSIAFQWNADNADGYDKI